ncbi:MAG: lysophospholipid acyltransferase family protein [Candidatus Methylomirabilales bacterium]
MRRLFLLLSLFSLFVVIGALRQKKVFLFLTRCYLFLGRWFYGLHVEGAENMPTEGPCIIVVNHTSPLGALFVFGKLLLMRGPKICLFYAGGFSHGLLSFILRGEKVIGGVKGKGQSTAALWKGLEMLRAGNAVVLAPEGEMSWDGRLQPLTPGTAWLALRAGVPVVPVVSKGAYDIMPRWAPRPHLRGKITIRVGRPFYLSDGPPARVTNGIVQEASQRIWKETAALLLPSGGNRQASSVGGPEAP